MWLKDKYRCLRSAFERPDPGAYVGILDFVYQHYALGDTLIAEIMMAIEAIEAGRTNIDLILAIDPGRPCAPAQGFINPGNYIYYFEHLLPAFLCTPMLRSLRLIRDRVTLNLNLQSFELSGQPTWPSIARHIRMDQTYPVGHAPINAFYRKHGYIPKLHPPRGYDGWAKRYLAAHFPDKFVVILNPRQSSLTSAPVVLYRDAVLSDWYRFMRMVASKHPNVVFMPVGAFVEWENRLQRFPNVFIPRTRGLHLGHELALLANADMFIGTSSGFATYATFSDIPYLALNIENYFSAYAGVEIGDEHYPFAAKTQILTWQRETPEGMLELFERILALIDMKANLARRQSCIDNPPCRSSALDEGQREVSGA